MTERSKELQRVPPEADPGSDSNIIIGIGASADGVDALQAFFSALPDGGGLAFVVVQPLDPTAGALLTERLGRCATLPIIEICAETAIQAGRTPPVKEAHAPRMLVIEDSPDSAQSIEMLLTLAGYPVVAVAQDGETGLALARRRLPDVVICDIGLPGMDGYAVARTLREDPRLRSVCLIALTGYGDEGKQRLAQEAGFDRYLTKPLDLRALEETLARRRERA